jgi:hypothetical protein
MTGHRQEMFTIELTVGEIQEAVERRILEKYKFLAKENGWECQELGFYEKNLNGIEPSLKGAGGFYVKDIPVVEDDVPFTKSCNGCKGTCPCDK